MIEIVTVGFGLLVTLVRAGIEIRRSKRTIKHLEAQSKINKLMRNCISKTNVDRFLILKMTNSANLLLNGVMKRYLVSCINEEHKDIHTSVQDFYQFIPVDSSYKNMVLESYNTKYYHFITAKESDGDLKRIYEKEGIVDSRLYFIHTANDTLYFCSIASYTGLELTLDDEKLIESAIAQIRESYKTYYD